MFWVHCGLFVLVIAVPGFISSADSTSKREQVVSSLYVARLVASRHVRRLDGILDTLTRKARGSCTFSTSRVD
ncbi:hypothetical protein HZH68_010506 [Vespula germanica]|uniref:Secreted protein n=3 Tax=Vespula TaxID=7451 RepID=A0A834JU91_VESGE|nr:hypothetical protein HZH68_010506 [Vespula germanica]KAF7416850.1 hypothetical protein H0235_011381 [Vespula pensylvanica]